MKPLPRHIVLEFGNRILICTLRWHNGRADPAITITLAIQMLNSCRFLQLIVSVVQLYIVNGNRWNRGFSPSSTMLMHSMQHSRHQVLNTACPVAVSRVHSPQRLLAPLDHYCFSYLLPAQAARLLLDPATSPPSSLRLQREATRTLKYHAHLFFTSATLMPEAFLTKWASPQSAVKTVSQPHRQRFCLDRSDLQQVHNFASHISSFQPQNPGTQLMQLATSSRNVVSSTHAEPCLMQRVRVNTDARRKTTHLSA